MIKKALSTVTVAVTTAIIATAALPPNDAHADLRMRDLFHSYSASSPGRYSTRGGNVWTGGSFQVRYDRPRVTLINFNPASASVGCGGLDFYGGSFGLISGDELTQIARGIAQGASTYFFKLALKSVCSGCEQAMSELQNTLNQFNDLARNTCERTEQALTGAFSSPEETFGQQGEQRKSAFAVGVGEINSIADGIFGTVSGWGGTASEQRAYNGNSVVDAMGRTTPTLSLGALGNMNLAGESEREKAISLMMTLMGTTISTADPSVCANPDPNVDGDKCIIRKNANFRLMDAFFGENESSTYTRLDCGDNYVACINVIEEEIPYGDSLYEYLMREMVGGDGAGLLHKIWVGDTDTNAAQQAIQGATGMIIPRWFRLMKEANLDFNIIGEYIVLEIMQKSVDSTISSIHYMSNNIKNLKGDVYSGVVFGNDLDQRAAELREQLVEVRNELTKRKAQQSSAVTDKVLFEQLLAVLRGGR